jgi:predicted ATP-dependent serine protease
MRVYTEACNAEREPLALAFACAWHAAVSSGFRRVDEAAEVDPEPVEWLWEGFLAKRTVTILSGEPGVNKSTMAYGIAAGLSVGKSGKPANSLVLTTEDSFPMTVRPRLEAAGADLTRIRFLEKRRNGFVSQVGEVVRKLQVVTFIRTGSESALLQPSRSTSHPCVLAYPTTTATSVL